MPQIRNAARADGGIFLVIHHVFVNHRLVFGCTGTSTCRNTRIARSAIHVLAVERPRRTKLERRVFAFREKRADNLIELLFAVVINLTHRSRKRFLHGRRRHKRIERGLRGAAFNHALDVGNQDISRLSREIKNHIGVHRHKMRAGIFNALDNFLAAAVLVVTVHLLQKTVIETLNAHGKALHAPFQLLNIFRNQVVRVRLARNFFNARERVARQINGFAQLINHNGRRATANVDALEVIAQVFEHEHFFAHVLEIRNRTILFERKAVERTVRAQALAERHVHIQHVFLTGRRRGHTRLRRGRKLQIAIGAAAYHRA